MKGEKEIITEWNNMCISVASEMRQHVLPFTTPISIALSNDHGEHHGSGTYIESNNKKFLITNEHVSRASNNHQLTHMFWGSDNVYGIQNKWSSLDSPIDTSICKISQETWNHNSNQALAVPIERFASKHEPEDKELLFFAGYSGDRSKFYFGHLFSAGTPLLTQEIPIPENTNEADEKYHFALPYKPDKAVSVDGTGELPRPPGFSGSVVWDTKRLACIKNDRDWSPEMAEITGIVWGWPSSQACILATKVEHIEIAQFIDRIEEHA